MEKFDALLLSIPQHTWERFLDYHTYLQSFKYLSHFLALETVTVLYIPRPQLLPYYFQKWQGLYLACYFANPNPMCI